MTLNREFHGYRAIRGRLVSTWTALELNNPEVNTGAHRQQAEL